MRKTPLKKTSKQPISKLQRKLWELCKQIIRKRYPPVCYTCGRPVSGSNDHTSHMIPKAACGAYLKYDLRNLRRTCYNCNINLGGNGAEFYRKMMVEIGATAMNELLEDRKVTVKAQDHYLKLIEEYKQILT